MSHLIALGLSHHTAPLDAREGVVDGLLGERTDLPALLAKLREGAFAEAAAMTTCNRIELYGVSDDPGTALKHARRLLSEAYPALDPATTYGHRDRDAVRHVFRVAASLDSMVVGEPQILGQVKAAFEGAQRAGSVGMLLGRCFTRAFAVAKRVRSETGIAEGTVSVSSIATSLARKIFGELDGRKVLLLGAGEMGEAAAKALSGSGAHVVVVNRSPAKAERLAEACGGRAAAYEQLASELVRADVVITSTSSPTYVLTHELMRDVAKARRGRPLFLIDIAVPRDVDPRVGGLESVFLYDVDDLQRVAEENLKQRAKAAEAAERIVEIEVEEFEAWRRSLALTPTIIALREHFQQVAEAELQRSLGKLELSDAERKALERMTKSTVNKLLHAPLAALKKGARGPHGAALIDATRTLFDLEDADEAEEGELATELSRAAKKTTS